MRLSETRAHARTLNKILIAAVSAALVLPGAAASAAAPASSWIVRAEQGRAADAMRQVRTLGGSVQRLGIPGVFAAELTAADVAALDALPSIAAITPDAGVELASVDGAPAERDLGQLVSIAKLIGADRYWNAGYTGQGIDVALIDSGVAPVRGLVTDDKVIHGPDLSFESQSSQLRYVDTYGHGTHMAGIIAGRDNDLPLNEVSGAVENRFMGVAPGARIVSLKVADAFGTTDISQVIAAIGWVIRYGDRDGLNVRVLNLAFSTDSIHGWTADPLSYAVERAWKKGIFVVVSVGNREESESGLSNPATNPWVMAVGATVRNGTVTRTDDSVAWFSRASAGGRNPDLVAPGRSILSLRVPGSYLDQEFPAARVGETPRLFLGSGTSQAAAVVSGAAALILSRNPGLSPNKVKDLLKESAYAIAGEPGSSQGAGLIDLDAAFSRGTNGLGGQSWAGADGSGGLGQSRNYDTVSREGEPLVSSRDIFGNWQGQGALAQMLSGGGSATNTLVDRGWISTAGWDGRSWTVANWDGRSWTGRSWTGRSWTYSDWTGRSWTSDAWDGRAWTSGGWGGRSWTGRAWTGRSWTYGDWTNAIGGSGSREPTPRRRRGVG
ncbi:MAG: S8 family serine peptidase, partial [Chloroflexota bacterium]